MYDVFIKPVKFLKSLDLVLFFECFLKAVCDCMSEICKSGPEYQFVLMASQYVQHTVVCWFWLGGS